MVLLSIYGTPPGRSYGQTLLKQEKLWKNLPKTRPLVVVKCKVWNAEILFATSGMQNVGQHCCWLFGGVEDFSNCWQSWLNNNARSLPTLWNVDGIILDISQSVMIFGVFSLDMMQEKSSQWLMWWGIFAVLKTLSVTLHWPDASILIFTFTKSLSIHSLLSFSLSPSHTVSTAVSSFLNS